LTVRQVSWPAVKTGAVDADTKFVIDPGSGESRTASESPQNPQQRGVQRARVPHANDSSSHHGLSQITMMPSALRSAIHIASLDHAIFPKISSRIGTFSFAASRHERDSFYRLFLAPQQKAMGRF
jgi:hypothetical protein